MNRYLIIIEV